MRIRKAGEIDMDWVNARYNEVNFPASVLTNEIIAIAEDDKEKFGLGRLIQIDDESAEMGGFYVLEKFQGKGIASKIIQFLIKEGKNIEKIYLLPFENLQGYYQKFGFSKVSEERLETVPKKVLEKWKWCNENLKKKVLLFELEK